MGIKSELDKTASYLRTARKAILGRGGEISLTAGLKDLPEAIFNIPADTSLAFYEDEETAYQKTVPSGAEEYALLKQLGGMTYKDDTTNTLRDTKVTEIVSKGANLLNEKAISSVVITADGITRYGWRFDGLPNGKYRLRAFGNIGAVGNEFSISYKTIKDGVYSAYNAIPTTNYVDITIDNGQSLVVYLFLSFTKLPDGINLQLSMINADGTAPSEYKPYREPITYSIPEAVQVSKGVGNYCDTIDFENGKKIQKCNTIVFDGTESWSKYGSEGEHSIFSVIIKGKMKKLQSSICSHFKNVNNVWGLGYGFQAGSYSDNTNEVVYFRTTQADVNEWKNYLKEQYSSGNPVILTYALAEPIITDILTDDNFLSAEGGGTLEFVNEHSNAVPSTVKYTVKVGN